MVTAPREPAACVSLLCSCPVSAISAGHVRPDSSADVAGYLARLGLEPPQRPDAPWLAAAHRAHMARIPYENLEIQTGRATTLDPGESIARIVRGRGGYCFHLNGAFGTLLATLGYRVTRHAAQVFGPGAEPPDGSLTVDHQALTVFCDGVRYYVDCGLGDAPLEPIPLEPGRVRRSVQPPFTYRVEPWAARPGGWRFVHDPKCGGLTSVLIAPEPVGQAAFAAAHQRLSGAPDSGFVRRAVVARRTDTASEVLRGRVFTRVDADGETRRVVETRAEWYELLAGVFGLHLSDVDEAERARLWARVSAAHEVWLADQAAPVEPAAG